jgi:hypothetical protein
MRKKEISLARGQSLTRLLGMIIIPRKNEANRVAVRLFFSSLLSSSTTERSFMCVKKKERKRLAQQWNCCCCCCCCCCTAGVPAEPYSVDQKVRDRSECKTPHFCSLPFCTIQNRTWPQQQTDVVEITISSVAATVAPCYCDLRTLAAERWWLGSSLLPAGGRTRQ